MTIINLAGQPWVERLGWTLIHFLWQGALIAAAYAIARRSRNPQFRYLLACLALAAMTVAPVVTFTLLDHSPTRSTSVTAPIQPASLHTEATPTSLPIYISETWHEDVMPWLVMAWFAGAVIFWTRLTGGWIVASRMRGMLVRPAPAEWQRKLDELKTRIRISQPVRLLTSAIVQVPTVVGWLRPVILMPIAALAGLPIEQIEALLAHELAHIRRHDYLVNILQSVAEALLFYHPAVWWISTQIRNDRELCCDDVAVAISGDALIYARALADLESYRPPHLSPALAANGGSLADRIARLLGVTRPTSRILPAPAVILPAALIVLTAYGLLAQPAAPLSFEAATIKLNNGENKNFSFAPSPGRLHVVGNPTSNLIGNAFGIHGDIEGGPEWINSDLYDLEAKAEGNPTEKQMMQMLQTLLEDRLKLKVHMEQRQEPVYELLLAKSGIKLQRKTEQDCVKRDSARQPKTEPDPNPSAFCGNNMILPKGTNMQWTLTDNDMTNLAAALSMIVGRKVIDKTAFHGTFSFQAEFMRDQSATAAPDLAGKSILNVLQEQLGLRLESAKGPVDVLVIDHIERPSEN